MSSLKSCLEWAVYIVGFIIVAVQVELLTEEFWVLLALLMTMPMAVMIGFVACAVGPPSTEDRR